MTGRYEMASSAAKQKSRLVGSESVILVSQVSSL